MFADEAVLESNRSEQLDSLVPRDVKHVIVARLGNLMELERQIVRIAAVIGDDFQLDLLKQITSRRFNEELLTTVRAHLPNL